MEEKLCSLHHRPSDDYDAFKPCFFDEAETEEEFYDVPAPSEDIWKKFELLPTPPRSPKHEISYPSTGLMNSTLEKLQMVSDILEPVSLTSDFSMFPEDCALCSRDTMFTSCVGMDNDDKELNQSLKSNLIQDCMWSGHMGIALEKKVKELDAPATGTSLCNTDVSVSTTVCVNPQSVFPYPLNEGESTSSANLEIDTPSDSDDDDDDDDLLEDDDDDDEEEEEEDAEDEEEEEEIDVVSISERHGPISDHRYTATMAPAVSVSAHVAAMHNYTAPHPRTIKSEPMSPSSRPVHISHSRKRQRSLVGRPPTKRPRLTLHLNTHKLKNSRLSAASSRSSSDSEDGLEGNKRSQHNILERKRRNDLKSSFHILRDAVPELSTQDRAPKVVILKKAADFITQLKKTSKLLQSEQERLRLRREQLKQKLKSLQRH